MMNHRVMQQQNAVVFCPKPRRLGLLNAAVNDPSVRTFRWHLSCQGELCDSKSSVSDPLDNIRTKGGCCVIKQSCTQVASLPPFFCGSPPSRVANPLIQDTRFGDEKFGPVSPPPSPSSSARKGGCVLANFGNNPAVRIEGFDCLDRDRRNCSIPALA